MRLTSGQRMALCAAPYVMALMVFFAMIQPAWQESDLKKTELDSARQQYDMLKGKVKEKADLEARKTRLNDELARLRAAVPQSADMDILMLDLERMSELSGVTLLGVEELSKENKKASEDTVASIMKEMGGHLPPAGMVPPKQPPQAPKPGNPQGQTEQDRLGLKQVVRRVFVSGNYQQLTSFLKALEAYQRVVGIHSLAVAGPPEQEESGLENPAADKAKALKLNKPVMSFLMSVYYLP